MKVYRIKSGDTLSEIAERLRVPMSALLFANPQIADPNKIYADEWLRVPHVVELS